MGTEVGAPERMEQSFDVKPRDFLKIPVFGLSQAGKSQE
jgi:hypothetical protein